MGEQSMTAEAQGKAIRRFWQMKRFQFSFFAAFALIAYLTISSFGLHPWPMSAVSSISSNGEIASTGMVRLLQNHPGLTETLPHGQTLTSSMPDGCESSQMNAVIDFLSKKPVPTSEHSVSDFLQEMRQGGGMFQRCVKEKMECNEAAVANPEDSCSVYPRCRSADGFYCLYTAQSISNRVLYCLGKYMPMKTGHSFDFFAATAGIALPLTEGLLANPTLRGVPGAPLYTSAEMLSSEYDHFAWNMEGRNYVMVRNEKCAAHGFDMKAYVHATKNTLEILASDPNGEKVEVTVIDPIINKEFIASCPNLRYYIIQEHGGEANNQMQLMESLVEEKTWTRLHYSRSWYNWGTIFKKHRPDTNIVVYVRGYMPDLQAPVGKLKSSSQKTTWQAIKSAVKGLIRA